MDIHENTNINIFTNRMENLESKITGMQEENEQLKSEVKALHKSIEFQNETQKKMKKKTYIKTRNWLQEYRRSVKDRRQVEDRHRRNNLQFMGIKKKKKKKKK